MAIKTLSSKVVYENPWLSLREDEIERADGSRGLYSVIDKPDFALVIPMENDGFHLVEQYRYPIGGRSWEFPAGSFPYGVTGSPDEMAIVELAEETGLTAGRLEKLGRLHGANAMTGVAPSATRARRTRLTSLGRVKVLFALGPAHGLALPLIPLAWAARAAGHEVLVATTSRITEVVAGAGLAVADVFPDRDVWNELVSEVAGRIKAGDGAPRNPFGLFTRTMTGGTIDAGRRFDADLVVYSSDHRAGALASVALGRPALEVGNRVSWSMRDIEFRDRHRSFNDDDIVAGLRASLGIPAGGPVRVARIDPRPPSMGGLVADEPDEHDGVPWWPMRFVPFNGGVVLPDWALREPDSPRVCVTLGTVVPAMSGTSSLTVALEALGGMDVEVVLAEGAADLGPLADALPANVRRVGYLPLSAFLPGCSLIVHHGGSGTTAAPLHYGVPQLVLPSFADNPMSAERVVARGVGLSHDPSAIDVPTVRALAERLLTEPAFAGAAAEVAAEMATQPSPSTVIERVTAALQRPVAVGSTTTKDW